MVTHNTFLLRLFPMHKILQDWPGQSPQRKERVEKALREGRFVVHGLPFTTHTELLEAEDLVRGLGYSSRVTRRLGLELSRDGKMTDVPEHTWMMATLLKHAGIDFMMIGCNGGSAPLKVPSLYWWEGPDGSRVLTFYSPEYGTELAPPPAALRAGTWPPQRSRATSSRQSWMPRAVSSFHWWTSARGGSWRGTLMGSAWGNTSMSALTRTARCSGARIT